MPRDYYDVLGVARTANKEDIKRAFRGLARQYHPDISREADAADKFKEINEAYEILSDDNKRARYDRFGHAGVQGNAGFGGGAGVGGFEDIFEDFFGAFMGGRGAGTARRGAGGDIRVDATIDFVEAAFGVEKEIEFQRLETCDVCNGNGAAKGHTPTTCPECKGTGEVRQVRQTMIGSVVRVAACPRCGSKGTIVTHPCHNCDGSGRKRKKTAISVNIPAGVHDGLRIQVRGEGDAGEGNAPRGDLYIVLHVREHAFFKRKDSDIIYDLNINVAQAALGDKLNIPTLDGEEEISIPPGTQTGKVFRLRGKGIPRLKGDGSYSGRGDQLIYVQVVVPSTLTDEQRQLFQALAATFGKELVPPQKGRGFFDRMMEFLNGQG